LLYEERRNVVRRQLGGSVAGGPNEPKTLLEAVNRYQNEQRTIEYVLLDRAHAGEIAAPTPEALLKYFDERKVLFRAPEYRKLIVVALIPAELAVWIEIPEADVKAAYEARRGDYGTPERRHIYQMVFPDPEEARVASERIAKGAGFAEVAKE